jgi:lipopolysaccharide transport system ATP-binding protein
MPPDLQSGIVFSPAVEFSQVSKSYSIYAAPGDRLKEFATFQRRRFHEDYWALRDVTFDVGRGETFCIVGENGCGKSTLLQICAGILQPTSGTATVHGRVSALLELGAGFNPEFSGRDNVYLNGAILGFSAKEMDLKFSDITEFAEIGEFIHQPAKTYSTGMVVRLAFAVAIHVDPEVLLVDEALAVGDVYFRQRCLRKVHELRSRGVTILFVSHSMGEVKALGDRALWLDHGKVSALGAPVHVVSKYMAAMAEKDAKYQAQDARHHRAMPASVPVEVIEEIPNIDHRYGDGRAEILGIAIYDASGRRLGALSPDATIVVRVDFAGVNTESEGHRLPPMPAGEICTVDFYLDLPTLYSSSFSFSPAVSNGTLERHVVCDWIDNAVVLEMIAPDGPLYGHFRFPCRVEVNSKIGAGAAAL